MSRSSVLRLNNNHFNQSCISLSPLILDQPEIQFLRCIVPFKSYVTLPSTFAELSDQPFRTLALDFSNQHNSHLHAIVDLKIDRLNLNLDALGLLNKWNPSCAITRSSQAKYMKPVLVNYITVCIHLFCYSHQYAY